MTIYFVKSTPGTFWNALHNMHGSSSEYERTDIFYFVSVEDMVSTVVLYLNVPQIVKHYLHLVYKSFNHSFQLPQENIILLQTRSLKLLKM